MLRVVGTLVRHCSDIMETVRHQLATLGYVAPEVVITKTKTKTKTKTDVVNCDVVVKR